MKKNLFVNLLYPVHCFFSLWACFAQRVSADLPWSVRMVESEMIRCPELGGWIFSRN